MSKQCDGKSSTVSNGHRAFGKGYVLMGYAKQNLLRGVPSGVAGNLPANVQGLPKVYI